MRLAISARPSASTSRSMRLPDQPLEASVVRSAIGPSEANSSSAGSGSGGRGRAVRPRGVDPVALHAAVLQAQVVALAQRAAALVDPLEPDATPSGCSAGDHSTSRPGPSKQAPSAATIAAGPWSLRRAPGSEASSTAVSA